MVLGIFGAGGFGREVLECVKQVQQSSKKWDDVLFIDDVMDKDSVNNVPVRTYSNFKSMYDINEARIFIAVGEPASRKKLYDIIKADGYTLETIIHPQVWIPDTALIGEGVYISSNAFISCNVTIGDNTLMMPYASVGHDSIIGTNCVCSEQSNIAGNCIISDYVFLGLSSIVREKVSIAEWNIVSAGSAVLRDVLEPECVLVGIPARKMQKNTEHKVF